MLSDLRTGPMVHKAHALYQYVPPVLFGTLDDGARFEIDWDTLFCQVIRRPWWMPVLAALEWQRLLGGLLIYRFIQMPCEPYADAEAEKMNAALQDMLRSYNASASLPKMVEAEFWGGTQDEDGVIAFESAGIPEGGGCACKLDGTPSGEVLHISGSATRFPLEVGYCGADQMLNHLDSSGCVARWGYGQRYLTLLERV
jgi:hypothetical protein